MGFSSKSTGVGCHCLLRRNTLRHLKWLELRHGRLPGGARFWRRLLEKGVRLTDKMMGCEWGVTRGPGQTLGGGPPRPRTQSLSGSIPSSPRKPRPFGRRTGPYPACCSRSCFRKVLILERTKPDEGRVPSSACVRVTYIRLGKRGMRALTFCAGAAWGPRAALCLLCTSRVSGPCIGAFCCYTGFCPQTSKTLATGTWRTNLGDTRPLVLKRPNDSCRNGRQVTLVFIAPDLWGPSEMSRFVVRRDRLTWLVSRAPHKLGRSGSLFRLNWTAQSRLNNTSQSYIPSRSLSRGSSLQHISYTSASNSVDFCLALEEWGWRLQNWLSHLVKFLKSFPFGSFLSPPVPCT